MALTPAQKAARRRRRQQERQQRRLNPLTAPFKTPAQLRAEAQRMADLSVVGEDVLREEQRRQESGLGALSGTLGGVLGGYQQQVAGGLAGLGALYGDIAGQARTAGGEALAAAGVAPGDAPAVSPTVASQFANIGALTSGYVPAAVTTGQRLIGESKASLTKALADRASSVSQNMARFLQDLQRQEFEKAISRETIAQNAARLGVSEAEAQRRAQVDAARLGFEQQRVDQGWARIQQQALARADRAADRETNESKKTQAKVKDLQNQILRNPNRFTQGGKTGTGRFNYTIRYYDDTSRRWETVNVIAANPQEAYNEARGQFPPSAWPAGQAAPDASIVREPMRGNEITEFRQQDRTLIGRRIVNMLVNAGMNRRQASAWVQRNVLSSL